MSKVLEKKPKFVVGQPTKIKFHSDEIVAIYDGKTIWVAVKPIIENLGLKWEGQYRKIIADPVLSQTIDEKSIVAKDGKQRTMLCLPIEYLNGFLFKINPSKIPNPQVREKVILYQKECYKALFEYFFKGYSINRESISPEQIEQAKAELEALKMEKVRTQQLNAVSRLLNSIARTINDPNRREIVAQEILCELFGIKDWQIYIEVQAFLKEKGFYGSRLRSAAVSFGHYLSAHLPDDCKLGKMPKNINGNVRPTNAYKVECKEKIEQLYKEWLATKGQKYVSKEVSHA